MYPPFCAQLFFTKKNWNYFLKVFERKRFVGGIDSVHGKLFWCRNIFMLWFWFTKSNTIYDVMWFVLLKDAKHCVSTFVGTLDFRLKGLWIAIDVLNEIHTIYDLMWFCRDAMPCVFFTTRHGMWRGFRFSRWNMKPEHETWRGFRFFRWNMEPDLEFDLYCGKTQSIASLRSSEHKIFGWKVYGLQ